MDDLFGDAQAQDEENEEEEELGFDPDSIEAEIPDAFMMSDDDEIISIKLDSLEADIEDDTERALDGDIDDDEIAISIDDEEDFDL